MPHSTRLSRCPLGFASEIAIRLSQNCILMLRLCVRFCSWSINESTKPLSVRLLSSNPSFPHREFVQSFDLPKPTITRQSVVSLLQTSAMVSFQGRQHALAKLAIHCQRPKTNASVLLLWNGVWVCFHFIHQAIRILVCHSYRVLETSSITYTCQW